MFSAPLFHMETNVCYNYCHFPHLANSLSSILEKGKRKELYTKWVRQMLDNYYFPVSSSLKFD